MGWDYYTYETQPKSFIEEIIIFIKQENAKTVSDMQRANSKRNG